MLNNLKIKNYRLFEDFEIPTLANVNLIVGENNSGKSSLLEAIYLLTGKRTSFNLLQLLDARGEYIILPSKINGRNARGYEISRIFHAYLQNDQQKIEIISGDNKLSIFQKLGKETQLVIDKNKIVGGLHIRDGLIPRDGYFTPFFDISKLITAHYLGYDELAALWDKITLTPAEDKIIEALQILEPSVNRISFTSSQTSNSGILLRLDNQENPIPLGSMGDGMRRILTIAASLVNVSGGTLLIDEIDTGLYYATLVDMWTLILKTAQKENVQVFATTHSNDCIKAFTQALNEFENPEFGKLIRLDKEGAEIKAVLYLADELDIAIEQDIEVR